MCKAITNTPVMEHTYPCAGNLCANDDCQCTICHGHMNFGQIKKWVSEADPTPILHNEGEIYLQYPGWSLDLHGDGTWNAVATDGG